MIERVRAPGHFGRGGPYLSETGVVHLQLMHAERAIRGARLHGSINMRGGRGEFFTSALSAHRLRLFRLRLRAGRAPSPRVVLATSPRPFVDQHGSPATHRRDRPAAVASLNGDEVGLERASECRPAGGERRRAAPGVD
jgi:hypothetical protein